MLLLRVEKRSQQPDYEVDYIYTLWGYGRHRPPGKCGGAPQHLIHVTDHELTHRRWILIMDMVRIQTASGIS
jgi:hypothetical protein